MLPGKGGGGAKNLENLKKSLFPPHNPLITHKTAKGIFEKACRIQAENLEMFGEKLGNVWKSWERPALSQRSHSLRFGRPVRHPGETGYTLANRQRR
jgi:hypothetical protein